MKPGDLALFPRQRKYMLREWLGTADDFLRWQPPFGVACTGADISWLAPPRNTVCLVTSTTASCALVLWEEKLWICGLTWLRPFCLEEAEEKEKEHHEV